jgi:hypothetical protein
VGYEIVTMFATLIWTGSGPEVTFTWEFLSLDQKYRKIREISIEIKCCISRFEVTINDK